MTVVLAAGVAGLAGCAFQNAQFSVDSTESATVTEIRLSGGGSGNVTVLPSEDGKTHIHREVHYAGDRNDTTPFHLEGSILVVSTDCGWRCGISYDIRAPQGVRVTGESSSGNVRLTNVSDVDLRVDSGSVLVDGSTGVVRVTASSGDVEVNGTEKDLDIRVDSGNITARAVRSPRTVLHASSGRIEVRLAAAGNVQAVVDSGGITLDIPVGRQGYRVQASADSGTKSIDVPIDSTSPYLLDLSTSSGDITVRNITA